MYIKELEKFKYKIETHAHSNPASSCSNFTPGEVAERYSGQNFDGVVLTNHFLNMNVDGVNNAKEYAKWYLEDYHKFSYECEKLHLKAYLGLEIRFCNVNNNDFLVYGIDEEDVFGAAEYLNSDIETFYKEFKNDRNVILQAHPFRQGSEPADTEFVDGYEAYNMHPNHNNRPAVCVEFVKKQREGFLVCGGTDFHHEGHQGMIATMTETLPEDSFEVAKILKSGNFIFNMKGSIILP